MSLNEKLREAIARKREVVQGREVRFHDGSTDVITPQDSTWSFTQLFFEDPKSSPIKVLREARTLQTRRIPVIGNWKNVDASPMIIRDISQS